MWRRSSFGGLSSCLFVLVVHQTLNASESVRLLVYALAHSLAGLLEGLFGFAASSSASASSRDGSDGGGEHGEVSRLSLLREEKEKVRERFFLCSFLWPSDGLFAVTVLLLLFSSSSSFMRRKWQSCGELGLFVCFFCVVRGAFKKVFDG